MSKISVTTIAGLTSGGDANKVKIESGDTLQVESNATVGGTLGVTGAATLSGTLGVDGHGSIGNSSTVAGTRALTVVGASDGSGSEILNCYNSSLASKFSVRDDGIINAANLILAPTGIRIGGTATGNTMDDYEEGTYTPTLASTGCTFSYSVQLGSYVKVGNLVYLQFNITLSNRTGTTNNVVFLDNVPFLTKNVDNSLYSGGHIGHYFNVNLSAGTTMVYQIPAVSTNQIELKEVGDNIGENGLVASELNTNAIIRGSVLYRAAT